MKLVEREDLLVCRGGSVDGTRLEEGELQSRDSKSCQNSSLV